MSTSIQKGLFFLSLSSLIFMISGYFINIILGRYLGPADYGIYGVVISMVTLFNLLQSSGLSQSVSKYISENNNLKDQIIISGIVLQSLLAFLIVALYLILSQPIAIILNDSSLSYYFKLSAFIFPTYGLYAIITASYNGLHEFNKQTKYIIIYSITRLILLIPLVLSINLKGVFISFILSPLITILIPPYLKISFKKFFPFKKLVSYSISIVGYSLLFALLNSLDIFFLKALSQSKENIGFFTANQNISRIPFYLLNTFAMVLFPIITKNVHLQLIEESRIVIRKSLRYVIILLVPSTLLISASSKALILLFYSEEYLPASQSLSILIFGVGFLTIFSILSNILNGAGKPLQTVATSLLAVIVTSFFCFILIPQFELNGAALATTIGGFIAMVIVTFFVYKKFRALIPIKSVIKIFISSFVIYFLALAIHLPLGFLPLLYIFLFAIYFLELILLREISVEDFNDLKKLLPKRFFNAIS